ncbi:adult-specific rigid cuticular protein 15.7-like [Centruroides vittatus]|uniref:adult-specific rigid cuticular protein 15.7-like n=1 Tax=Centruroides vittatus TaxID=120091 RepID=UPI00350EA172
MWIAQAVIIIVFIRESLSLEHADGKSESSLSRDNGDYNFQYSIHRNDGSSNSRSEMGNSDGLKMGSYSLTDIDGRKRSVDYVADHHGFRVVVRSNEPGTMNLPEDHPPDQRGTVHVSAKYPPGHAYYLPLKR